jgi:hypothetical protein
MKRPFHRQRFDLKGECRLMLPLVVALSLLVSPVPGEDGNQVSWPQFRGPAAQGVARDGLKLPAVLETPRNLVWKTALPRGHSSPCVWDERVFVTVVR